MALVTTATGYGYSCATGQVSTTLATMGSVTALSASRLAQATPASRDRYVDLLRVLSLGVVILGHWLMVVVDHRPDGTLRATNLLALLPALQPLTWLFQIMPVFFLVGGFSHAMTLSSLERRSGSYVDFAQARGVRLLRPTALFVTAWLLTGLVLEWTGHHEGVLRLATRTAAQPLWFVGVYLLVVTLAPAMLRLHRRLGPWAPLVPAALGLATAGVDLLRFGWQVPYVGNLNVLFVWLAVHQLGFLYADGTLQRGGHRLALLLTSTGLAATVALCLLGPYPVSMVGMPGARISNMAPPTLALYGHAIWITGLVLLLRGPGTRWLQRPRVWRRVVAANGVAMTAFLWHLTAMFGAAAALLATGWKLPATASTGWWLLRPLWLAVLVALTALLVAAFRWADRPRPAAPGAPPRTKGAALAATGLTVAALGILGLSAVGFGGILAGRTVRLVVLPVTPLTAAALVAAGAMLLWTAERLGSSGH